MKRRTERDGAWTSYLDFALSAGVALARLRHDAIAMLSTSPR